MGPLPNEPSKDVKKDFSDNEDYEQDGWQIGYAVELNGIGIQRVVENPADNDSESDGYEGPGEGSDNEMDEHERAGYQQIPFSVETADDSEDSHSEDEEKQNDATYGDAAGKSTDSEYNALEEEITAAALPETLHASIQKEFEQALSSAKEIHLKDSELLGAMHSSSCKIELDDAKIDEIKEAVSRISLPPPSWAKDIDDEKLKQMLQNIKSRKI